MLNQFQERLLGENFKARNSENLKGKNKQPYKETLIQVFSFEFCEISKNTFFKEHLRWLLLNEKRRKQNLCSI